MTETAALEAVRAGDLEGLRSAVRTSPAAAVARDPQGVSIVMLALYRGRRDLAEALLAEHGPLDVFEATALGRAERVRELADADRAQVSSWSPDGFQPLHFAAWFGHAEIARLLLERGADAAATARNPMGVAPLHSAVAGEHAELVRLLLERGVDPDARQHQGWTALQAAAHRGRSDIVDLLLARGADPGLAADDGRTAQDLALEKGHRELADRLATR